MYGGLSLKLLLCVSLSGGCICIGVLKVLELRERVQRIRDLQELLHFMERRIAFEHQELRSILKEAVHRGPICYRQICSDLAEQYHVQKWRGFSELWEFHWKQEFHDQCNKEEMEILIRLGRQLGRGGPDQQIQAMDLCTL